MFVRLVIFDVLVGFLTSQLMPHVPKSGLVKQERKLYNAARPPPSHLFPQHTMDNSQDEFIIDTVGLIRNLHYCYFSVLAFLIYDASASWYLLNILMFNLKSYPISSSFDIEVRIKDISAYWSHSFCCKVKFFWVGHVLLSFIIALTMSSATA